MEYRLFLDGDEYKDQNGLVVDGTVQELTEKANTLDKHRQKKGTWAIVRISDRFIHTVITGGTISEFAPVIGA